MQRAASIATVRLSREQLLASVARCTTDRQVAESLQSENSPDPTFESSPAGAAMLTNESRSA